MVPRIVLLVSAEDRSLLKVRLLISWHVDLGSLAVVFPFARELFAFKSEQNTHITEK